MRIDRSHAPWAFLILGATTIAALLFVANFHPDRLPFSIRLPAVFGETPPIRRTFGGTPLGLIFGSVAFVIFLFASALGIRKKKRLWRIGSVQWWLRAHIWLSVLTIPLVLFHCGFRMGGLHTTSLFILYVVVIASGFFGLALQQFMPRLMQDRLPREVIFDQIPHLRTRFVDAAERFQTALVSGAEAPLPAAVLPSSIPARARAVEPVAMLAVDPSVEVLAQFLDKECLPYLRAARGEKHRLGSQQRSDDIFRVLNLNVADKWRLKVDELQTWCNDRRLMDLQTKLHHWLHGWLLVHVPASFALMLFTLWHAWVAVRFLVTSP